MSGESMKDESHGHQNQQTQLDTTIADTGDDSAVYSPIPAKYAAQCCLFHGSVLMQ